MHDINSETGKVIGEAGTSPPPAPARMGRPPVLSPDEMAVLRTLGEQLPGASVAVIAERLRSTLSRSVSDPTVARALVRLGVRRKNARASSPSPEATPARAAASQAAARPDPSRRYQARHRKNPPKEGGYPSDLTDEEWALVEPLLRPKRRRGPLGDGTRATMNALMYMTRTGCQWRYLPRDFPRWDRVAKQFYRWVDRGIFAAVNAALRTKVRVAADRAADPTAGIVDSQTVRTAEKGGCAATTAARR